MNLSSDHDALLRRAQQADAAADLYLAPGGTQLVADRVAGLLYRAPAAELTERALWNLLFAAGELSLHVDLYRALYLFESVVAVCERLCDDGPTGGRAAAIEMSFDFFFARAEHPLLPLRAGSVIRGLTGLFEHGRVATRTALHGLGHLVALARAAALRPLELDAIATIDHWVQQHRDADPELAALADEARAGSLR